MTPDEILARLGALPEGQQKEVKSDTLRITSSRYFVPNAGPQTDAYFSPADELFYGGGAGGGKSALLCGLAIEEHSKSIIFRRKFPQVRGLVDELREHAARGKPIQRAIGFVHFPERSEKKQGRRSKSAQVKRSR